MLRKSRKHPCLKSYYPSQEKRRIEACQNHWAASMTALSLKRIVEKALAEVGANINFALIPRGKVRTTTWLGIEHDLRHTFASHAAMNKETFP
jgi:hypothetical protein